MWSKAKLKQGYDFIKILDKGILVYQAWMNPPFYKFLTKRKITSRLLLKNAFSVDDFVQKIWHMLWIYVQENEIAQILDKVQRSKSEEKNHKLSTLAEFTPGKITSCSFFAPSCV